MHRLGAAGRSGALWSDQAGRTAWRTTACFAGYASRPTPLLEGRAGRERLPFEA